ncbi:SCO family protein [Siphonobacter sp. SORGH_AS_0500]|uniref:SCO family protein n=1 Tax=Siphonobacter sp. SORGH_AS_0500 TaxID=1864824 RepID=UPI000CBF4404|nr:SCO family protein [Siphonobacter sp. SORGH_AS_0500]MDR6197883.1 protein SCO1/2 [Siphonobacter sp. SORGH_AS_0500]PKK37209.1 SCO family protein [Siphonobacter sp. SORGH_AS_0500]
MRKLLYVFLMALLPSCHSEEAKLPLLGTPHEVEVNGKLTQVYPSIPDFSFVNQNGDTVRQRDLKGKIYVADFFFTTCPTICPIMKRNLLKVYKATTIQLLSHTIDPDHDTPAILKRYALDLGVVDTRWQFVTGDRKKIYELGEKHYLITAQQDSTQPGGYIHSGHFILVDPNGHVRGLFDGTSDEGTQQTIEAIALLKKEFPN